MRHLGALFFTALLLLGMAVVYSAYATGYVEGKQYQRLPNNIADNNLVKAFMQQGCDKVQVIEFFSYGCEWCYKLDPYIEKWRKDLPTDVDFERVPVEFHPTWGPLTKAYYTEVRLNILDKIHSPFFEALQQGKVPNGSEEALRQYFATFGISAQQFNKVFESNEVASQRVWANGFAQAYRITSVPVVVVQGSKGIFMTAVRYAGSEDNVIKVVNELIKVQKEGTNPKQLACTKELMQNKQ